MHLQVVTVFMGAILMRIEDNQPISPVQDPREAELLDIIYRRASARHCVCREKQVITSSDLCQLRLEGSPALQTRENCGWGLGFVSRHVSEAGDKTDRVGVVLSISLAITWREVLKDNTEPANAPIAGLQSPAKQGFTASQGTLVTLNKWFARQN